MWRQKSEILRKVRRGSRETFFEKKQRTLLSMDETREAYKVSGERVEGFGRSPIGCWPMLQAANGDAPWSVGRDTIEGEARLYRGSGETL